MSTRSSIGADCDVSCWAPTPSEGAQTCSSRALDSLDSQAYAASYTEDGQFRAGANAVQGQAALLKMVADLKKDRADRVAKGEAVAPMYHMTANSYTEFVDRDHARVHTYWLTVFGSAGEQTPLRVAAAGRGVDDVVRVNGQWLIKSRNVTPQD
jgi:roadblock/LC7 domain-containing protein